ncbi:MAG: 1-acyl-sn-glycerol-3-phosphate acyltransferase [Prochloraceae cyanobacterium]
MVISLINALRLVLHLLLIRPLLRLLFGVNVVGHENLEELDHFILVANHNSHLDIFLLFSTLPPRKIIKTHPVAARDYFEKPPWLFKTVQFLLQPIWVDRRQSGLAAIREIQRKLEEGASIIMFPEGTRGQAGELQDFHGGIGLIARKNPDVPVVPVYLEGPERVFPKKTTIPLPLWNHITIGPPQCLQGDSRDIALRLHDHLKVLADQELAYRQRRMPEPHRPLVVAAIGIDGSGKSTVSRRLATRFKGYSCFIGDGLQLFKNGEPCETQPLMVNAVRKWIGRRAKNTKNLARYKLPKLVELLLRDRLLSEVERWYRPDRVFMDGSPLLNMTAWAALYHEEFFNTEVCAKALAILSGEKGYLKTDPIFRQFPELGALCKLKLNHMHMPDVVIFLDVSPEVSLERIASRAEALQAHENIEKLTKLRDAYHLVCDALEQRCPTYRLDGNKSLEKLLPEVVSLITAAEENDNETD